MDVSDHFFTEGLRLILSRSDQPLAIGLSDPASLAGAVRECLFQLARFIEDAPVAIAMFDASMCYLAASRRYMTDYRLASGDPATLLGRSHYDVFPDIPDRWREANRRVLAGETMSSNEDRYRRADGEREWLRWKMMPWRYRNGDIGGCLLFSDIITGHKKSDQRAEAGEERFRQILESSPFGMIISNASGAIEMVNKAAERIFGYERSELFDQPIEVLVPDRYRSHHRHLHHDFYDGPSARALRDGREVAGRRKDGSEVPLTVGLNLIDTGEGRMALSTIIDLTEQKKAEAALRKSEGLLRQAQKMEAIGKLTGGLAHDFNNLLSVIIGNLDLARPLLAGHAEANEMLRDATDAALRGAELASRLLTFARRQSLRADPVSLNDLVANVMRLLERTLGETIQIKVDLAPHLWTVVADAAQVESVIMNLAINARDAMPSGGQLRIATTNCHVDIDQATMDSELEPGDYVVVEVTDTGTGIPRETVSKIFEPFFTTKPFGRGTGLGLSMVYGFMKQTGGHITVASEPGAGTAFHLYFPRSAETSGGQPGETISMQSSGGGQTILVVEDNDALARLVGRQLGSLGYRVLQAHDATEALVHLAATEVDLLFTDIVMPGAMDGWELARHVQQQWPGVRILLTSGFSEIRGAEQPDLFSRGMPILSKPYRQTDLAQAVHDALARPAR